MDRWQGKVALVTGANSGIGWEISQRLVKHGMKVVGVDLRTDSIKADGGSKGGSICAFQCDLCKDEDVLKLFKFIEDKFKVIHILINTAGLADCRKILETGPSDWRKMLEINVIAITHLSKLAIELMGKNNVDDGHIVNFASVAGHKVSGRLPFYSATKFAVRAVSECLRQELREAKSAIRISTVSPGLVESNLYKNADCSTEFCDTLYSNPSIVPGDIAATVEHMLAAPPHVQIFDATVMPTGQIFGPM